MDEATQSILAGIVRHLVTTGAGVLVTHGYIQSSQTEQVVGAVMLLVGIGWSWWQKNGQAAVKAELDLLKARASAKAQAQPAAAAQVKS